MLLLRLLLGSGTAVQGIIYVGGMHDSPAMAYAVGVLATLSGAFVLVGLLTPASSAMVAACLLAIVLGESPHALDALLLDRVASSCLAVVALALTLLGPGGFSIDAWWFGRREIIFHDHLHPPT